MGKLLAGVAVRKITPKQEILDILREEGHYFYDGIFRDLYTRVVVLTDGEKKFVYIGNDLSYYAMNENVLNLLKEFGIEQKDCYFSGTRSHNTISSWPQTNFENMNEAHKVYGLYVLDKIREALKEAFANVQPARIGSRTVDSNINTFREQCTSVGNFEGINHNGPRAPWLRIVRIEDLDGKTMAVLMNYCMQNCSLCWNQTETKDFAYITSDLAAEITDYVERAGKREYPVLWSCGGGADQQPIIYSLMDRIEVNDDGEFYKIHEILNAEGQLMINRLLAAEQGQDALRAIKEIDNYSDEFNYFSAERYTDLPRKGHAPHLRLYNLETEDFKPVLQDEPLHMRYAMAVIDGIAFCGSNGPTYSGVYGALKDMMPFETTVFFDDVYRNYDGDISVVVPPEMEENGLYNHASRNAGAYTARLGYNAFMAAFGDMLAEYMLTVVPYYENAEFPVK